MDKLRWLSQRNFEHYVVFLKKLFLEVRNYFDISLRECEFRGMEDECLMYGSYAGFESEQYDVFLTEEDLRLDDDIGVYLNLVLTITIRLEKLNL